MRYFYLLLCFGISPLLLTACSSVKHMDKNQTYQLYISPQQYKPVNQQAKTLQIAPIQTRAGINSTRIAFIKQPHQLNYYSYSHWSATPSEMLTPLIVNSLEQTERFKDITTSSLGQIANYRLEITLEALHHSFLSTPSQIEMILSAKLLSLPQYTVLAKQRFIMHQTAHSDDAYGAVSAANEAIKIMLPKLNQFVTQQLD